MQNLDSPLQPLTRNEIDGIKSLHSLRIIIFRDYCWNWKQFANSYLCAAWKMSKHGVFSDLYFPIFGLIAGKYGTEKNSVFARFSCSLSCCLLQKLVRVWQWCQIFFKIIAPILLYIPADTGRKLNVHKTFRRRPGRLLNVLCTFNLRPVSTSMALQYNCISTS